MCGLWLWALLFVVVVVVTVPIVAGAPLFLSVMFPFSSSLCCSRWGWWVAVIAHTAIQQVQDRSLFLKHNLKQAHYQDCHHELEFMQEESSGDPRFQDQLHQSRSL